MYNVFIMYNEQVKYPVVNYNLVSDLLLLGQFQADLNFRSWSPNPFRQGISLFFVWLFSTVRFKMLVQIRADLKSGSIS